MLARSSTRERGAAKAPAEVDALIAQIADSDTFRAAPMMRTLLTYLWEHRGEASSEYAIAVDALGRPPEFDPKVDSAVRVQIARLRTKLKEFYANAEPDFPLRVSIPLGRHELEWEYRQPPSAAAVMPARYKTIAAGIFALCLLGCIAFLLIENRALRASLAAAPPPPPLPRFWQSFLVAGKPTVIVVPNPLYFIWPTHGVYVRDLAISEFPRWSSSPILSEIGRKWGAPDLSQSYVGAMEMNTAVKLLQYLEKNRQQVQLLESRRFPADSFAAQNTIFLGMPRTAVYLDRLVAKTNFYIAQVQPDIVKSRSPNPGEAAEYREVSYSSDRRVNPAIIALLPVRPERTRSLLLMGRSLNSMSAMLLSLEGLKLLDEQWVKGGSPDAWEMVIQAEIYRDTVLKFWPVAFRPIAATFWK